MHDDDLDVLGRGLQREPHGVLARPPAGDDGEGRVRHHAPEDPPRAGDPGLGRGDDDGAYRRVAREVLHSRGQDRHRPQAQELLGRTGAEARADTARGDERRHLRHRRAPGPRRPTARRRACA